MALWGCIQSCNLENRKLIVDTSLVLYHDFSLCAEAKSPVGIDVQQFVPYPVQIVWVHILSYSTAIGFCFYATILQQDSCTVTSLHHTNIPSIYHNLCPLPDAYIAPSTNKYSIFNTNLVAVPQQLLY